MDNTDLQILKILQKKARIPNVEVARKIDMAPSAVLERIKKLEARGIIQGYEVRLDPAMFRSGMIAFILVRLISLENLQRTGQALSEIECVQEVHFLAGEDSLLLKVRTGSNQELADLLNQRIATLENIGSTRTLTALSTFKESAEIPIPKTLKKGR